MGKKRNVERTHLSVIVAAEQIGVSEATVLAWINTGKLKAINVGAGQVRPRWRIAKADWQAFLDQRSNQQQGHDRPAAKRRPKPRREYV